MPKAFDELNRAIRHMPMEKEPFVIHYIIKPIYFIQDTIANLTISAWRRIIGAWYCEYCKKYHSRRCARYKVVVCKQSFLSKGLDADVCNRGVTAAKVGVWLPKRQHILEDLAETLNAFAGVKAKPADAPTGWTPKLLFRCDPSKNTKCTKEHCWVDCQRTENIEFSVDQKILWPDKSTIGRTCHLCPLNPNTCQKKFLSNGKQPPCETVPTYTDYVRRGNAK